MRTFHQHSGVRASLGDPRLIVEDQSHRPLARRPIKVPKRIVVLFRHIPGKQITKNARNFWNTENTRHKTGTQSIAN